MKSIPNIVGLLVAAGITTVVFAQSTDTTGTQIIEVEQDAAGMDLMTIDEADMTFTELKARERREERERDAIRCLGIIAVPGDISLTEADIQILPLELEADDINLPDADTVELLGSAYAQQGPKKISADSIRYSKASDTIDANGAVEVFSPYGDRLRAEGLSLEMETFTGDADDVGYVVADRTYTPKLKGNAFAMARGQAASVEFLGHDLMQLEDATYTNCAEGSDDVVIKAKSILLDHSTGTGTARSATLRFLGVPIFYLPYMTFPISDERKSGLLAPTIGSDTDEGFFVGIPYYWNISPGLDATFTPVVYSDRGIQLVGQVRYLTETAEGELNFEYLPSDDLQTGPDDEQDRSAVTFYHIQDFTDNLVGEIDYQWASDADYYDDFTENLYLNSASHLPRLGRLNYYGGIFRTEFGVSDYYTIDDSIPEENRPYAMLPYLTLGAKERNGLYGMTYELDASAIQFDRESTVEGWRYFMYPSVSLPLREVYGYLTPKLGLNYASYDLTNTDPGEEDSPYRYVTTASVDSSIFFERDFSWADRVHVQTLEPRLFYVYIPKEDQAAIPDFDTSNLNLNNFSNIWRENRFIGEDRIGDTNQVTLGLTSRFLDGDTGEERGKVSIGQIYYFSDREISLTSDDANIDNSTSDFLAEGDVEFYSDWTLYGFTAWDTEESESRVRRLAVTYGQDYDDVGGDNFLTLGYYFNRDANEDESVDLGFGYRFNTAWSVYAQDIYSVSDSENRYLSGGVRYDGCCWKVTVGAERRFDKSENERDSFFLTFEFTGLTRISTSQGFQ